MNETAIGTNEERSMRYPIAATIKIAARTAALLKVKCSSQEMAFQTCLMLGRILLLPADRLEQIVIRLQSGYSVCSEYS